MIFCRALPVTCALKKSNFNVKNNRFWNYSFLLREIEIWLQNQIERIISSITPTFFKLYTVYGFFEKIKYQIIWTLSLFFALLQVFRAFPVTRNLRNYFESIGYSPNL